MKLVVLHMILLQAIMLSHAWMLSHHYAAKRFLPSLRMTSTTNTEEVLLLPEKYDSIADSIDLLQRQRNFKYVARVPRLKDARWVCFRKNMHIDSCNIEELYLGAKPMPVEEMADTWNQLINRRLYMLSTHRLIQFADGTGAYQREINTAVAIVQRACYASRALQRTNMTMGESMLDKPDSSPVTVADFGVQAILLHTLHIAFPNDTFIAEEDSSCLQDQPELVGQILDFVEVSLGEHWSPTELFTAIDLGKSQHPQSPHTIKQTRTWVLDPIDGTKGFIRKQHYCIALGLLERGQAVLSVLGCPNLNLNQAHDYLRQGSPEQITQTVQYPSLPYSTIFDSQAGSVYFAVSDQGAIGRTLDMPIGAGWQCSVSDSDNALLSTVSSNNNNNVPLALCESFEAFTGRRDVSAQVTKALHFTQNLRLDGQCKAALVGCGRVEASLRLPPAGYVEKIWDHVPAYHFIQEAGGKVTDLQGRPLRFDLGRELDPSVEGLVLSCGGTMHDRLLEVVNHARLVEKQKYK